jgi:hypothetical protein
MLHSSTLRINSAGVSQVFTRYCGGRGYLRDAGVSIRMKIFHPVNRKKSIAYVEFTLT